MNDSARRDRPGSPFHTALTALVLVVAATSVSQAAPRTPRELAQVGFRISSLTAADAAGFAVATGDFDGDGVADVAVGAPCDATAAPGSGAVYVLYGPITPGGSLAEASATLVGVRAGDFAGETLAVLDLDGDGADELVVGAPGPFVGTGPVAQGCLEAGPVQPGVNRPGEAYVLGGGSRLAGAQQAAEVADTVITGLTPLDFTSYGMGSPGDLDGDGKDDLVVGAAGPGAGTGAAWLFAGGDLHADVGASDADAQLIGEQPADAFGYRIAGGDLDGDGVDDLVVAAPGVHPARTSTTYVFLGGELPSGILSAASADVRVHGEAGDRAGHGLAVDDLDGDGVDDLILGAPVPGVTSVFYGPMVRRGDVSLADADVRVAGGAGRQAGWAVAAADLDDDDRADLLIGAEQDTTGGELAGAVHRLNGPLAGDVDALTTGFTWIGDPGDQAGFSLATGDLTGDGDDDLVVGAPALQAGTPGGIYIVTGDETP